MSMDIFDSAVRSSDDLGGVFEYDGETGYFYLYQLTGKQGQKIIDALHIISSEPDFGEQDVAVRWDPKEEKVGLFIRGILWAVFDCSKQMKYGGNYRPNSQPSVPKDVAHDFIA